MKMFKKEREVSHLALQFLGVTQDCVAAARRCIDQYLDGDLAAAEEERLKVGELESRADADRRDIGDKLYSGAYLPLMRGDIHSLIESLDGVPDAAEACSKFFLGQRPLFPPAYVESFREWAHSSFDIIEPLSKVVKAFFKPKYKMEELRERARQVSIHESKVDAQVWELINRLFSDQGVDLAVKLHAKRALSRLVEISDRAEDSADHFELVGVKSVG